MKLGVYRVDHLFAECFYIAQSYDVVEEAFLKEASIPLEAFEAQSGSIEKIGEIDINESTLERLTKGKYETYKIDPIILRSLGLRDLLSASGK